MSKKVVDSGSMLEFYKYDSEVVRGFQHEKDVKVLPVGLRDLLQAEKVGDWYEKKGGELKDGENKQRAEQNDTSGPFSQRNPQSISRSNKIIDRAIHANFYGTDSRFITLTFGDKVTNIRWANNELKKAIKRVRRNNPGDFGQYLAVPELHPGEGDHKGCIHYHLVVNGRYIPKFKLEAAWGQGWVKINRIYTVFRVGYLVKYLNKAGSWVPKGYRLMLASTGLIKPIEYLNDAFDGDISGFEEKFTSRYFLEADQVWVTYSCYEKIIPQEVMEKMYRELDKRKRKKQLMEGLKNAG